MTLGRSSTARSFLTVALAAPVACFVVAPANAQTASEPALAAPDKPAPVGESATPGSGNAESGWRFTLSPYVWVPSINGDLSVNGNDLNVDGGLFDTGDSPSTSINFALMLHAELSRDRLSLLGDFLYLDTEANRQGLLADQDARLKIGIYELGAAYSVLDTPPTAQESPRLRLEPLAGIRVYDVDARITGSAGPLDTSTSAVWVDGFVGARARLDFNPTLAFFCRGDVGAGGSDLVWSAVGALDIRLSEPVSLELGYRALNIDFTKGRGANEFNYDLLLHGPFLAVTIRF